MSVMVQITGEKRLYLSETFSQQDLSYEEFNNLAFEDCTFVECDFSETKFANCTFTDCHFVRCNLSVARLDYSKLQQVEFDECKLVGIDWTRIAWPNLALYAPVKFEDCILNDGSFHGLKLSELAMLRCRAHDVDFREADLSEAKLIGCDLRYALFHRTNLNQADFTDAENYDIDVNENFLKGAKFSRFEASRLLESLGIELVD